MLLAPSSYGKSSVIEAVDQPVRTLEAMLRAETANEVRASREALIYVEAQIKAKKTILGTELKKGEGGGSLPSEIAGLEQDAINIKAKATPPALVADDFTVEAATDLLECNDERVTVTSGDTGIFNIQRYGDNPSIELLLKCWKGEPHREIRRGRDRDADLQGPSMAMLLQRKSSKREIAGGEASGACDWRAVASFSARDARGHDRFSRHRKSHPRGARHSENATSEINEQLVNLARSLQANEGGAVELSAR